MKVVVIRRKPDEVQSFFGKARHPYPLSKRRNMKPRRARIHGNSIPFSKFRIKMVNKTPLLIKWMYSPTPKTI